MEMHSTHVPGCCQSGGGDDVRKCVQRMYWAVVTVVEAMTTEMRSTLVPGCCHSGGGDDIGKGVQRMYPAVATVVEAITYGNAFNACTRLLSQRWRR